MTDTTVVNKLDELINELQHWNGHHPEADFIDKFVTEQRKIGTLSDDDLYHQVVEHVVSMSRAAHGREIMRLNKQISDGINELKVHKEWPNLISIAKHACSSYVEVLTDQSEDGITKRLLPSAQFKNNLLKAGEDEFVPIIVQYLKDSNKLDEFELTILKGRQPRQETQ